MATISKAQGEAFLAILHEAQAHAQDLMITIPGRNFNPEKPVTYYEGVYDILGVVIEHYKWLMSHPEVIDKDPTP